MKTVQIIPFDAQIRQEKVLELPLSARIVKLLVALAPSPIQMQNCHQMRPSFSLVVVVDMEETSVPRRFVVVSLEEALPDGADHIDTACLQAGPEAILVLSLFEIPPQLELLLAEKREYARA